MSRAPRGRRRQASEPEILPNGVTEQIRVPGRRDPTGQARAEVGGVPLSDLAAFGIDVVVRDAVRVEATRDVGAPLELEGVDPDAVVELVLDGGVRLFVRADEAVERLRGGASRSAVVPGRIDLAPTLPMPGAERGLAEWAIQGLRVLGVDLPERGALAVAERVERKLVPEPGLKSWDGAESFSEPPDLSNPGGPCLLFLHGTASSTRGSFGGLGANAALWMQLIARYGDRILALDHWSLTQSPIDNAVQALEALPKGAELHLVSHSRGGLIGELLCRASVERGGTPSDDPFDEIDLGQLAGDDRAEQRQQLEALRKLLKAKAPRVTRFVRVACPARGTTLASARLDRWLNVASQALGLAIGTVPVPGLGEVYDGLQALLLAAAKERTDPETLPGLEAMIPGSPLIKILNRPDLVTNADLSIVTGDCVPSGILRRLAIWFTDAFYGEDHDLVVNTSAMIAGIERKERARVFFDQGPSVDHFHYFANPRTAERVVAGLLRTDGELGGFEPLLAKPVPAEPIKLRSRANDRRPIAFVLPGITGSHLAVGGRRVWINPLRLAFGGLADLAIGNGAVGADGPIEMYYKELCEFLDETHQVRPWAYDWRRPIMDIADSFGTVLGAALDEARDRPVRIVAHSMGGLVARSALTRPELWGEFKARDGGRLVMLGTPNGGSWSIPFMLLGRNQLMSYLAAVDLRSDRLDHLRVIAGWSGALQMLPADGPELLDLRWWADLKTVEPAERWATPDKRELEAVGDFRRRFDAAPVDPERMFYIAGQAETIDGILVDPTAPERQRIAFSRTLEGDGQVTWKSGIPSGLRAWFTDAAHGDLARHRPAFGAIADLLTTGRTTRLPNEPVRATRGRAVPPPILREPAPIQPTGEDLALAGLGGRALPATTAKLARIRVSVVHGHLAFATHPVLLGHYNGDSLAGPEAALDQALGGRLGARRLMALYPGPIGTSVAVLDNAQRPPGAIVTGLGDAGELSAGTLVQALQRGLLAYAAAEQDRRIAAGETGQPSLAVSTLLIGSGDAGLPRAACVQALLLAARLAQQVLAAADPPQPPLGELEIIDVIDYRAVEIWHAAEELIRRRRDLNEVFLLGAEVERRPGARRQIATQGGDDGWWQPMQITMDDPERGEDGLPRERTLAFVTAAGRARAEATILDANLDFVERFIKQAIAGVTSDGSATPSRALFELMWPVRLKGHSGDDRRLRLMLDERTAAFPWELMDDRRAPAEEDLLALNQRRKPPSVRFGVIRQLIQSRFREQVVPSRGRTKALVIGDPHAEPQPGFAELPGAQEEARAVATLLRGQGCEVTELIGASIAPETVVMHLFAEPWTIIHIAAHGVSQEVLPGADGTKRRQTGVVLGGGLVLGPSIFKQLSVTPSLVFVNCCHLGSIDPQAERESREKALRGRPELAASVAVELIGMGVQAVIAAGWAVDDDAAETFATSFYANMLEGMTFGEAVKEARVEAFDQRPTGTTWGAYQCYGEPDWRLRTGSAGGEGEVQQQYASPEEAIAVAERICEELEVGISRDVDAARQQIEALEKAARDKGWEKKPDVSAALGGARGELGDFAEAIAHFNRAILAETAGFPVRVLEQIANYEARKAVRDYMVGVKDDASREAAEKLVRAAEERVRRLVAVCGDNSERWSLRGSCQKRLAQILADTPRIEALEAMASYYEEAEKAATDAAYYPGLMHAAARTLAAIQAGTPVPPEVLAATERMTAGKGGDFWQEVNAVDARVLRAVQSGAMSREDESQIHADYRKAWRHGGSPRKLRSILEQLVFLADVLSDSEGASKERLELVAALRRLHGGLEQELRRGR